MFTEIGRLYNDSCSHTIIDTVQQIISPTTQVVVKLLFLVVVIVAYIVQEILKSKKKSLPGPTFISRFMDNNLPVYLKYTKWAKQLGPIYKISKGNHNRDIIVLSCPKLIREAFNKEEFSGRPHSEFMDILDGHGKCREQQIPIIRYALSHADSVRFHIVRGLKHFAQFHFRAISRSVIFIKAFHRAAACLPLALIQSEIFFHFY